MNEMVQCTIVRTTDCSLQCKMTKCRYTIPALLYYTWYRHRQELVLQFTLIPENLQIDADIDDDMMMI